MTLPPMPPAGKAADVFASMWNHYRYQQDRADWLEKQLREAQAAWLGHNDLLRSALQVVMRRGLQTHWEGFEDRIRAELTAHNPHAGDDPTPTVAPIHGVTCAKVEHGLQGGYTHSSNDDHPYYVDGTAYCGRCHEFLPPTPESEPKEPT